MDQNNYDLEDLTPDCQRIAQQIGIKNLFGLAEAVGGKYIFIPKPANLLKNVKKKHIREDRRQGLTFQQLADKYDLSVDTIRRVVRK